ncbi:MAG: shikimate kinase [Clostridiales bacterium]|nr:shikimate kinase [Clostridiales bacterium]
MNIVLCGFMGCGKTTVGKILAQQLDFAFVDMDAYIEEKAGMRVSDIFALQGEPAFRRMEAEACRALSERSGLVIATGGGALMQPENRQTLAAGGVIVLIEVRPETVAQRLRGDDSRPLLAGADTAKEKENRIRELMEKRLPTYRQAAVLVVDGNRPARQVAAEIGCACKFYIDK